MYHFTENDMQQLAYGVKVFAFLFLNGMQY